MQIRELLKTQQFLNPLVSAKSTAQSAEWDAFSQLLTQKNNKTNIRDIQQPKQPQQPQSQIDLPQKNELKSSNEKNFSVKVREKEPQDFKIDDNKPTKVDEVDDKPVEKLKPKDNESKVDGKNDSDEKSGIKDKLKNALKAKLKKEFGLDDQQLDALLANLNLDMNALSKLIENGDLAGPIFSELTAVLETLEIDVALNQEMSPKDVDQVVNQIEKLVDALSKLQNVNSNSAVEEVSSDEKDGKAFEMKLIQSLSRVVASLSSNESETTVKPEDVRKSILEALSQSTVQTPSNEGDGQVSADDQVDQLIAKVVTTTQNSSLNSGEKQNNQNMTSEAPQNTTPSAPLASSTPVNAQTQVNSNDNNAGNGDKEVTVVEENKGINIHQMTMKQNNAMTSPTIMPSGQVKQEIFTQIMDAIKGQIKLSDHGTSLIVKLQPEQLGNVELKLNIQKGIVLAEIKVENEIVKAAIESNLDDLKQSLNNKGYSVDQINVSVDSGKKDQQQGFEFNGQERKNRQTQKSDENVNIENVETVSRYVMDDYEGSTINYYG